MSVDRSKFKRIRVQGLDGVLDCKKYRFMETRGKNPDEFYREALAASSNLDRREIVIFGSGENKNKQEDRNEDDLRNVLNAVRFLLNKRLEMIKKEKNTLREKVLKE